MYLASSWFQTTEVAAMVLRHPYVENLSINKTVLRSIGFGEICRSQGLNAHITRLLVV